MKLRAALLGCTGAVGQRYLTMLSGHRNIELKCLMGFNSAGKKYSEAVSWIMDKEIPEEFRDMLILETETKNAKGCEIVFSALPSDVAERVERQFAKSGFFVVSEASANRMKDNVPLMIPEVNPDHLELIKRQRKEEMYSGAIVTTPNCTVTGLALALKPLHDEFGIESVIVTTMQALSGAGYPGVPSLSALENVIPYIKNEEQKVQSETRKILGKLENNSINPASFGIAASCNRVPVLDGHMESVYCNLERSFEISQVVQAMSRFSGLPQKLMLPTAPERPIIVRTEQDRPQPRLDRLSGSVPGMSVVVGRIRNGITKDSLQFTLLAHNTVRGAAGNAILTAELAEKMGYIGT